MGTATGGSSAAVAAVGAGVIDVTGEADGVVGDAEIDYDGLIQTLLADDA